MRINGHAHIFNLQSVLTEEAIAIMVARLERHSVPRFARDAVEELLREQLDRPEYLSEDELLVRFVEAIGNSADLPDLPALSLELRTLPGSTGGLGFHAARDLLNWISTHAAGAGAGKILWDVYETLRVAMQPDIPRVAKKLLAHLGPDDAIVALMMDITAPGEPQRDRLNFRRQVQGTMDAVLTFPGRVLPFFAVNPRRDNEEDGDHHYEMLRVAIEEKGFFGVKLYPSLGYEVGTPAVDKVLEYCIEKDLPITIHTSAGGFFKSRETAHYSHPEHWVDLLEKYHDLRICFAHCGGWGGLCGEVEHEKEWADRILSFMADFPHVYADISYHVTQMEDRQLERAYFDALRAHLEGPAGDRIIFGTDSWLLRLSIDDALYWRYFERNLSGDHFRAVAEVNPRRFLGIEPARENARRHVAFLDRNAARVGATPARWVKEWDRGEAPSPTWVVTRQDTSWSINNRAHQFTFGFLRNQLPGQFRTEDFGRAGAIRMRQLDYYKREAGGPSRTVVEGMALGLASYCSRAARFEGEHDMASAERSLAEVFEDPNRTVAQVGGAVDALFFFNQELPV